MGKLKWIVGIIVLVIVGLVGYSYFSYEVAKREALKDCEFRLTDVGIARIGLTSADLIIVFEIYNPNDITATLDRVDFSLYGNDNYLGDGEITKKVNIPPYSKKRVSAPFTLYYSGAAGVIWSALKEGEVVWKITGIAYIDTLLGTMEIPFVFTTQKSKEIVHTGVEQATSSIELAGDVIGYGWIPYDSGDNIAYDRSTVVKYKEDSTELKTNGGSWNNLTIVKFYLQLTAGQHPVDLEGLVISYADEDTYVGNITYNKTANESAANMDDNGYLNMGMCNWTYRVITTSGYGDNDNLLELGEKAEITVTLPKCGVGPNKEFKIEVKPASGATLGIIRTTPPSIDSVMNLH